MYVTEEVSLTDFYGYGLNLAREASYSMVICFIAREADAPDAYDEIIKSWNSIDNLTGPKILFLFAGPLARERHPSANILESQSASQLLLFTPDALLLPSNRMLQDVIWGSRRLTIASHYDLEQLKNHAKENYPYPRDAVSREPRVLARHQPVRPKLEEITTRQTSEVSRLRDFLSLSEQHIPMLAYNIP